MTGEEPRDPEAWLSRFVGWHPLFLPHLLGLEVFHTVLHGLQLRLQAAFVIDQGIQLLPQSTEVGLKERLQVFAGCGGCLLLEKVPLGLQDLILLLQESHLCLKRYRPIDEGLKL